MDVDLVVAARPVMGARRLYHDAKGGDAPVALFDVRDAFENARLRFGDRLHPLELDLRRRLHQQLHSSDPGRRAACLVDAEIEARESDASQRGHADARGAARDPLFVRWLRARDQPDG